MSKNKPAVSSNAESGVFQTLFHHSLKKAKDFFQQSFLVQFFSSYDEAESYAQESFLVSSIRSIPRFVRQKISRKPHRELGTESWNHQEIGIFVPST